MSNEAQLVWDEYMEKISATDYGVEVLGDSGARQTRAELVDELKVKLNALGVS